MSIQIIKKGAVCHFIIDNPPVNVFTPAMHKQFYDALCEFYANTELKVGILSSTGARAFCAGDDIKSPRPNYSTKQLLERHFSNSEDLEELGYPGYEREALKLKRTKPIIAAIQSACIGQGLAYVLLMTDLRIASTEAKFGFPEINFGMGGAAGALQMAHQIPQTAAMYMVLTGELVDANYALTNHLINEIVEPDYLLARAEELAVQIARHPAQALQIELEVFQKTRNLSREEAMNYAENVYRLQRLAYGTQPPLSDKKSE
ncbi:MAG: enoyl-CoA hydratase/isomerase family protein [Gammaproteobacteria bacterium]|nr:enoyl-CoA hydratase/isomerase family protein [Gammaproteobacteria bacterium]